MLTEGQNEIGSGCGRATKDGTIVCEKSFDEEDKQFYWREAQ